MNTVTIALDEYLELIKLRNELLQNDSFSISYYTGIGKTYDFGHFIIMSRDKTIIELATINDKLSTEIIKLKENKK
jgi:hypothetical protein